MDITTLPFQKWHYISKSQSAYYYTDTGVYRKSNHWGRAAKCRWVLKAGEQLYVSKGRERVGFALWTNFYENSETTKAYFIKVDFENKQVTYAHKSEDTSAKAKYRTAKQTHKVIQKVKRILQTDSWAKYYEFSNIEVARKELVLELINKD